MSLITDKCLGSQLIGRMMKSSRYLTQRDINYTEIDYILRDSLEVVFLGVLTHSEQLASEGKSIKIQHN